MDEELKKLVIMRLQSWPSDVKIAFGSGEDLSRDDLIMHVEKEDGLGKNIVEMQMKYLRSFKAGLRHA